MNKLMSILLTSATATIGTMSFAGSYEIPEVDPPIAPPAAVYDWTGFFVGGSIGMAKGTYALGVSSASQEGPDVEVDGGLYSLRAGYNWQSGRAVYGIDMDIGNGPDGITEQGTAGSFWSCNTGDCNVDIEQLASLRGRVGYLLQPSTLVYGAAGGAWAKYEGGIRNSAQQGDTNTATGYTIGLGVEHKFSQALSGFMEVNHYDLGDLEFGTGIGSDVFDGVGTFNTVRIGLNFQF